MPQMFFDLGYPFVSSDIEGMVFALGYPFYSAGAVGPGETRLLVNRTSPSQAVPLKLGNADTGFYYAILPAETLSELGSLVVPAADITGEVVAMSQNGALDILTETNPPEIPDDIALTPGPRAVLVQWTNPSDDDFYIVRVIRTIDAAATSHDPEANASALEATQVFERVAATAQVQESFEDVGLVDGTTYFYTIFVRDEAGFWSTTVTPAGNSDSATPTDTVAPGDIANLVITSVQEGGTTPGVKLTWTNPSDTDLDEVMVRRNPVTEDTGSGSSDIEFVQGSDQVSIPTDFVIGGAGSSDFILGADGRVYKVLSITPGTGLLVLDGEVYLGNSESAASVSMLADTVPTDHTDGTQVYQNTSPFPTGPDEVTDFDGAPFPGVGLPSGKYFYAVFCKDASNNWNDAAPPGIDGVNTGLGESV